MTSRSFHLLLGLGLSGAIAAACGSSNVSSSFVPDGGEGGKTGGDASKLGLDAAVDGTVLKNPGEAGQLFTVSPSTLTTLTVKAGTQTPTVTFQATLNGSPTSASWSVDRGDIGAVPPAGASAVFTPTGTTGGLTTVTAVSGGQTVTRQVLVKLTASQNGPTAGVASETAQIPTSVASLSAGGGVGGVGGEGLGSAVTDPAALAALANPTTDASSEALTLLYPYENTVWPRGMLAPLLMWSWTPGDADAIQITLATASGSFSWTGTFGRPPILSQTMGAFIRQPIPQDVWDMATNTAGAPDMTGKTDPLVLTLTVEKGGVAAGPITRHFPVAPGRLTGSVYYNSYGTQLVKNWASTDSAGNRIGAAILGVRSGDTAPTLVVGQNSTDDSGCRVCHVVSSHGRWLITQSEQGTPGDGQSYLYDLTAPNVQASAVALTQQGTFGWAAMVGDGTYALTNAVDPSSSNPAILNSSAGTATSSFWPFAPTPPAAAVTLTGLPAGVAAGYPAYAPDDKLVAFVDATGHTQNFNAPIKTAAYDTTSHAFSSVQTVATPAAGQRIGYPVFLPDDSGLLYETEVRASQSDNVMVTRNGARSELWWVKLGSGTPTPVRLDTLNGKAAGASYLPTGANNHGIPGAHDPQSSYDETGFDDTTLNYEPTLLPIVVGGYAWVVFTSRRLYGNQLTAVPWQSWPPDYNTLDLTQATVKKLWVAAIDLGSPASSDISHPAFYLPAQELLAGNSRGFWVLDPCKADGMSCETGDQCCNGYCKTGGEAGALVCATASGATCSQVQEKCTQASDCCDTSNTCTNGFCAAQIAK